MHICNGWFCATFHIYNKSHYALIRRVNRGEYLMQLHNAKPRLRAKSHCSIARYNAQRAPATTEAFNYRLKVLHFRIVNINYFKKTKNS